MNTSDNGGPAFPMNTAGQSFSLEAGMTLRDYFAAKAMQALVPSFVAAKHYEDLVEAVSDCAGLAFNFADAMLHARSMEQT